MNIKRWLIENRILIALAGGAFVLVLAVGLLIGSQSGRTAPSEEARVIVVDIEPTTVTTTTAEPTTTTEPLPTGPINPLTGLPLPADDAARRPLIVVFDNLEAARPQLGLIQADIGIEVLAEGLITRLLGVFYSEYPEKAGPVRSARPYIVGKALEFDSYLAHVGGSMQALADIQNYAVADFDGLSSGAFRREPPKEPPHNTYLLMDALREELTWRGYRLESVPEFGPFGEMKGGDPATKLEIYYRAPSIYDDTGYYVTYTYDSEDGFYTRYMNGEVHADQLTEEALRCKNIIVQIAYHTVLDNEGRLAVDLVGEGTGHYFTGGKVHPITWRRDSVYDRTVYLDAAGDEILLAPGFTWIQIVKPDSYVFEGEQHDLP